MHGAPNPWRFSAAVGGPDCFIDNFDELQIEVSISSGGHNIRGDASDFDFASSTGDHVGDAENPIDPRIGPLADNGGPTNDLPPVIVPLPVLVLEQPPAEAEESLAG